MWESDLDLEHSFSSAALIDDIRLALMSTTNDRAAWSQEIGSLIDRSDGILDQTPDAHVPVGWRVVVTGLRALVSQIACVTIAQEGDGDLVAERARTDVLVSELRRLASSAAFALPRNAESRRRSLLQTGQCDADALRDFLLMIPLPPLYWRTKQLRTRSDATAQKLDATPSPMLRVIVFLDHTPIASPQLLKPNILYPLEFRVRGLTWPSNASRLRLDLLTTCPSTKFSVSGFALDRPEGLEDREYEGTLQGQIKFNSGQSSPLDDLVFTVRGAFATSDGNFMEIPVIGHNQLRLRVVNDDMHPLMTGNRRLDRHIEELVTKLCSDCPDVRDELPDLLAVLEALARLLATYAQEAIYKDRSDVSEAEFQTEVLRDLRNVLGQDVQEHPRQAGGVTDIRYRGVIVELKVEKENGERSRISKKYTAQAAQYASVEAMQVSVLLVLDLTSKDKPPSDIRNDIILTNVETHGGDDRTKEFPSKAFVVVINGNMKNPSTYSR